MTRSLISLLILSCTALGIKVTVVPGDALNDSLTLLGAGDTLYLTPGLYTSSIPEPMLFCSESQGGVTILSDPLNRAVLDGEDIERSVLVFSGPFTYPVYVENLVITGGNATNSESFIGGGVYCNESVSSLSNCLITENSALIGGGIGAEGSSLFLFHCTFTENQSQVTGGGLDLYASDLTGFMLRFENNSSSDDGGGLNSYQSSILLSNALFTGNYSGDDGGGMTILQGTADMEYITMNGNEASDDGGGMRVHTIDSLSLRSSIITSNLGKGGINVISTTAPEVTNTCCWNNEFANYHGMEDPSGTQGNLSLDPLFADSQLNLSQVAAGQLWNSPAVDAGHEQCRESSISLLSTRTDSIPDTDTTDMGFHHLNLDQTGTQESNLVQQKFISVSPSPNSGSGTVYMQGTGGQAAEVTFHDLAGRILGYALVPASAVNEAPVHLPSLPGGVVLVRAVWETGEASGRFVVIR